MSGPIGKCSPSVQRYWRLLTAGVVWLVVGMGLVLAACVWFLQTPWPLNVVLPLGSIGLGTAVHAWMFTRIARRNISRIESQPETSCLFAFQSWRSYLLILLMMLMGYAIRHLPIPKFIDGVIYFTMGSAMTLSSSHYFRAFRGR